MLQSLRVARTCRGQPYNDWPRASIIGWTGGHVPPTFWSKGDVMCFVPLLFRGTNFYYVVDLLNNDCFSSPIKHNNPQLNALNMFSGRASLGPTGRRTYSTGETPALRARERVWEGGRCFRRLIFMHCIHWCTIHHFVVPPTFLPGSTPVWLTDKWQIQFWGL